MTLRTVGEQTITATDTFDAGITGVQSAITVGPAAATHFAVSGFTDPTVAGVAHNVTVTALDDYNNTATGYTGTVHFTSLDGLAILPANTAFQAGWNGTHTFTNGVTFATVGSQTVTATDILTGTITGTSAGITVTQLPQPTHFTITGLPNPMTPSATRTVVVTALDASNHTVTTYTGTVHFASTDGAAVLPINYVFTFSDSGVHTFTNGVTLKTPGSQTVTVSDTLHGSVTGSQTVTVGYAGATFHAISPARVLDTRPTSGTNIVNIGLSGKFVAGTSRTFKVANAPYVTAGYPACLPLSCPVAVPANATAITGNLTIVSPTATGVVAVGPTVSATGDVTSISFVKGDVIANNVTVGLADDGSLSAVYRATSGAGIDVVFDITGYFTPDTSGATLKILGTPGRVLDTRATNAYWTNIGLAGPFKSRVVRTFKVAGASGIGWTSSSQGVPVGARGVIGNLTVTNPTSDGFVSIGPSMTTNPATSNVNVKSKVTRANGLAVALSGSGTLAAVWVGKAGSSADVIFDVTAYFTNDGTGLKFHPVVPSRILDSSKNKGVTGPFRAGLSKTMTIGGVNQIPVDASAISGTLTLVKPSANGYAYIGPFAMSQPPVSTVNAIIGVNTANGFTVKLSSAHKLAMIWVASGTATANLQLDVTGYWVP